MTVGSQTNPVLHIVLLGPKIFGVRTFAYTHDYPLPVAMESVADNQDILHFSSNGVTLDITLEPIAGAAPTTTAQVIVAAVTAGEQVVQEIGKTATVVVQSTPVATHSTPSGNLPSEVTPDVPAFPSSQENPLLAETPLGGMGEN